MLRFVPLYVALCRNRSVPTVLLPLQHPLRLPVALVRTFSHPTPHYPPLKALARLLRRLRSLLVVGLGVPLGTISHMLAEQWSSFVLVFGVRWCNRSVILPVVFCTRRELLGLAGQGVPDWKELVLSVCYTQHQKHSKH